jgi:hypothetical protein
MRESEQRLLEKSVRGISKNESSQGTFNHSIISIQLGVQPVDRRFDNVLGEEIQQQGMFCEQVTRAAVDSLFELDRFSDEEVTTRDATQLGASVFSWHLEEEGPTALSNSM